MHKSRQYGFTQVELIVTIVLIGILSAVAVPRFGSDSGVEARGFSDEVAAALRYAQKTAIASRRLVCASLSSSAIQLRIASANGASTCNTALTGPTGKTPHKVDASEANFHNATGFASGFPTSLNFDAQGRPVNASGGLISTSTSIGITGGRSIIIEAETGHVHF